MADLRAISALSEAVIALPRANYLVAPQVFNKEVEFQIYLAKDFFKPMTAGVSLFLYRTYPNGTHRNPRADRDRMASSFVTNCCSTFTSS
jgi:hypothetical protein